jgi:microcystin-dependent protein
MENPPILYGKDINTGNIYQLKAIGNVLLTNHSSTPIGSINQYAGNGVLSPIPAGWMICNGAAISRTTYADLYAVIGTLYGVGDNSTTFNLPNLQNRMPIGLGTGSFNALNNTGGAETYTLATNELPAHQHYIGSNSYAASGVGDDVVMSNVNQFMYLGADTNGNTDRYRMVGGAGSANAGLTSNPIAGSGTAFNKMSPYIVINFIIYTGYNILITPINTVTIPNAGINDLVDVSITTPADGQLLKYNSSGLNWTNSTIPIGGSNNGYITGTFPTVVPANATTGNLFTVPIAGNYVLNISASGINTSVAMINMQIWINGVNTNNLLRAWANEINSHKTLVPISFRYTLNAGNNYLYLRMIAGISDGNDFASFNWIYSPIIV